MRGSGAVGGGDAVGDLRDSLISLLVGCGAVRVGDFTLTSGAPSPFFVDLGAVVRGDDLLTLGGALARGLRSRFPEATMLLGPPYKGIVLATVTAVAAGRDLDWPLPILYHRKEAKTHGELGVFVGPRPTADDRVIVVDDVLSSGGTKLDAARLLEEAFGVAPRGILVVLDRTRQGCPFDRERLPVHALDTMLARAGYLAARGAARGQVIRRYHAEGS